MPEKYTVSAQKVWMKHYPKESQHAECPRMKVYTFLKESNKERLDDASIYYYGKKITVRKLIERIDRCADALAALGVKKGDTVSLLSASTPESICVLYALNKIGATMNAIDPRMDVKSISRMICSSGSKILVAIDIAYPKVAKILPEIKQEHIIIQSAATSLPPIKKIALKLMQNIGKFLRGHSLGLSMMTMAERAMHITNIGDLHIDLVVHSTSCCVAKRLFSSCTCACTGAHSTAKGCRCR